MYKIETYFSYMAIFNTCIEYRAPEEGEHEDAGYSDGHGRQAAWWISDVFRRGEAGATVEQSGEKL